MTERAALIALLLLAGCAQPSEPIGDDDDATDEDFTPRWVRTPLDEAAVFTILGTEEAPVAWGTLSFEGGAGGRALHQPSMGTHGVARVPMTAIEAALGDGMSEAGLDALATAGVASGQVQTIWMGAPQDVDGDGVAEVLTEHEAEKGVLIGDSWVPIDTRLVLHRGAQLEEEGFLDEAEAWLVIDIGAYTVGVTFNARLIPDVTGDGGAELALSFRELEEPRDEMLAIFTSEQLSPLPAGSLLTWEDAELLAIGEVEYPTLGLQSAAASFTDAVPDLDGDGDSELMVVFDHYAPSGLSPRVTLLDDDALRSCGRPCRLPTEPSGPVIADIVNPIAEGGIDDLGRLSLVGSAGDGDAWLALSGAVREAGELDNRWEVLLFRTSQLTPGARLTREDAFTRYGGLVGLEPGPGEQLLWSPVTFANLDGEGPDELVVRGREHRNAGLPLGVLGVIDVDAVPDDGDLEPHFLASFVAPDEEYLDPRLGAAVGYASESLGRGLAIPIDAGGDWRGAVWLVPAP